MHEQLDLVNEKKSQASASSFSDGAVHHIHADPFLDGRPDSKIQAANQEMVNKSPQVHNLGLIQRMANQYIRTEPQIRIQASVPVLQQKGVIQRTVQTDIADEEQGLHISEGQEGAQAEGTTQYVFSLGVDISHQNYIDFALARTPLVKQRKNEYKRRKRKIKISKTLRLITAEAAQEAMADLDNWVAQERASEKTRAAQTVLGNEAGENEIAALSNADQGHTWIEFSRKANQAVQKRYSFGFKPRPDALNNQMTGKNDRRLRRMPGWVMNPDDEHAANGSFKDYPITATRYLNALRRAKEKRAASPNYELLGYNCTAFAKEIMERANLNFPGTRVTVPLPGLSRVLYPKPYSPNRLMDALRQDPQLYQREEPEEIE